MSDGGAHLSGLAELNRALDRASATLNREVKKVVTKTALEVKRDAVKRVRAGLTAAGRRGGGTHLPHYPRTISYDIDKGGLAAEIGPDSSGPQGGMGRGVEFGSSKTGPLPHMLPAADKQEPLFHSYLEEAAAKAL